MNTYAGVDYGSKMAGTTAICYNVGQTLITIQSSKGVDADEWLSTELNKISAATIVIDAPLGIPLAYFGKGTDYFYRTCDRELGAMSPMFLGGLTARAMRLNQTFGASFLEGYPGAYVRRTLSEELFQLYKSKSQEEFIQKFFIKTMNLTLNNLPQSRHQTDAIICWLIAQKTNLGRATQAGSKEEGIIYY